MIQLGVDLFAAFSVRSPDPDLAARVADLEAYITNTTPKGLTSPGPGHNAWMMTSAALVLFMTLPGLALFYGGLVRRKNVLSVIAQCFGCAGLVTILWWLVGYSFTFANGSPFLGGTKFAFLDGVGAAPNNDYAPWVSASVFSMYQLMFAIITPALIVGAIAERMKYAAIMVFILGWMLVIYFPLAHMVWGIDGFMNGVWNAKASIHAIDFAGGTVVHMSSGWSALVLCLMLGKRNGFGQRAFYPHSLVLTAIGTGMLWVGWYGFNAGSAIAADGIAAGAFMATTIAAAVASVVWPAIEWLTRGKPTVLGYCSGAVAGLVVVTPASGFVTASGAMIIGLLAGSVPYFACTKLKGLFGYDDALDTFGVHGVGGTLGALVTGFLATPRDEPPAAQNGRRQIVVRAGIQRLNLVFRCSSGHPSERLRNEASRLLAALRRERHRARIIGSPRGQRRPGDEHRGERGKQRVDARLAVPHREGEPRERKCPGENSRPQHG